MSPKNDSGVGRKGRKGRKGTIDTSAAATEGLTVRTVMKPDVPVVRAFHQEFHAEVNGSGETDDNIADMLNEYALLAEIQGEPVGFLAAHKTSVEFSDLETAQSAFHGDDQFLEIEECYVAPRFRNRGIGSELIRAALQRARDNGIQHSLLCTTDPDHDRAIRFYGKAGFTVSRMYLTQ